MWIMAIIDTSIGRIGLTDRGSGPAVPILFLHGVGSDKSVWAPQIDHFAASRRSVALDYPGYGESELIPDATRDDFAGAVLAAMDALDIERAHLCGLSLGGVIAIAVHAAAPARCASLIIADSFAVHPEGRAIHDRSVAASKGMTMRALAEARVGALVGQAASQGLRQQVITTMAAIEPAAYRIGAEAVWLADQTERVGRIEVPTLIIVGDEDEITPPPLSEDLHRRIRGSTLVIVNGAGHLSNAEQPEYFNQCIDRFMLDTGR